MCMYVSVYMCVGIYSICMCRYIQYMSVSIYNICDRLWEKGAYGAENKNVVFNLF